jgi:hypothetical protein
MKALKIIAYIILSVCLIYFGKAFLTEYNRVTEQSAARGDALNIDDIDAPDYTPPSHEEANPIEDANVADPSGKTNSEPDSTATSDINDGELPDTEGQIGANNTNGDLTSTKTATTSSNRLGFYVGGFVFNLLALGLLAGFDLTRYSANHAVDALYNDDGGGIEDNDLYESAEHEWARGDFLEAVRILREYLAANPKQQHAAIRIAEIYEKDLKNPLAAALEYEEILTQKLTPDRWGWSAIHLANLYSGPMNKPEKAIDLLRELVAKYPETSAAEKASQRLDRIDNNPED